MIMHMGRITNIVKLNSKLHCQLKVYVITVDYNDAYIFVKGTISIGDNPNNGNKEVVFENCAAFIDFISEIDNKQTDNSIDVVITMYNLVKYSDNYSKTLGGLWQYYRDEPATDVGTIANVYADNNSDWFKLKKIR